MRKAVKFEGLAACLKPAMDKAGRDSMDDLQRLKLIPKGARKPRGARVVRDIFTPKGFVLVRLASLVALLLVGCGGETAPTTDGRWREVAPARGGCETLLDVAASAYTMHVQCWTAPNVTTTRDETGAITADWRINDYGLLLAPDGRAFARLP